MQGMSVKMKRKGQVTIPAEVRAEMGWDEGDQIVLRRDGNRVILERPEDIVAELYGSLAAYANPLNRSRASKEIIEEEKEWLAQAIADEQMETTVRIDTDSREEDRIGEA
jgi:AbrB family looped-hinge helix DNA binding protein